MGLVIVLLAAPVHGFDLLPDPIGWVLVLAGVSRLALPQRSGLRVLTTLSLLVSVVVWFPGARDALNVTDLALAWAAGLPQLATVIVLAHALAQQARLAGDQRARTWLQTALTLFVVVVLLPPVVLGGGLHGLDATLAVVGSLTLLLFVVLLFRYAGRTWAQATAGERP